MRGSCGEWQMVQQQRLPFQRVVGGVENVYPGDGRCGCGQRRNGGEKTGGKEEGNEEGEEIHDGGGFNSQTGTRCC